MYKKYIQKKAGRQLIFFWKNWTTTKLKIAGRQLPKTLSSRYTPPVDGKDCRSMSPKMGPSAATRSYGLIHFVVASFFFPKKLSLVQFFAGPFIRPTVYSFCRFTHFFRKRNRKAEKRIRKRKKIFLWKRIRKRKNIFWGNGYEKENTKNFFGKRIRKRIRCMQFFQNLSFWVMAILKYAWTPYYWQPATRFRTIDKRRNLINW